MHLGGGISKAALADMVYYELKGQKKKTTRKEALSLVETAILSDYIKRTHPPTKAGR